MFEFLTNVLKEDAIAILKRDHDTVKDLFEAFKAAKHLREKKKIVAHAILELKLHAEIEEKIFYPALRAEVEKDLMNEADEEHHVAKLLIAELEHMDASDDHWEAKFTVLSENVIHHIKEEENDMMIQARRMHIDFDALGQALLEMKEDLRKNGVSPTKEDALINPKPKARASAKPAKKKPALKVVTPSKRSNTKKPVAHKAKPLKKIAAGTKKTNHK